MKSGKNLLYAFSCQLWTTAIQCISNLIKASYENCKESRMLQQGSYVDTQVPKAPLLWFQNQLHWLPVEFRISYKILCMMHKVDSTTAFSYFLQFFSRNVISHPKRKELLRLPKCKNKIIKRSFSYQGAKQ